MSLFNDDDSGDYRRGYGSDGGGTAIDHNNCERNLSRNKDENVLRSYRISGSLTKVASSSWTDWFNEQSVGYEAQGSASSVNNLKFLSPGLPSLRMDRRNENSRLSCSCTTTASVGGHKIPRSQSRNTFESAEDSGEEGPRLADDNDIHFYDGNVESSNTNNCAVKSKLYNFSAVSFSGYDANHAKDQMYRCISKEAKASIDMLDDGKIDSTSASSYLAGNDSALASPFLAGNNHT